MSIKTTSWKSAQTDGKRDRSSAGLSSPVAGSHNIQRADQTSGQDSSDGWQVVKRKKKGRKPRQQSTPAVGPTEAGWIGGSMVSPPGSQPVRIQTEGRGTATRQTPETPARQPKSGPHLSRRQRRKKQRDATRQGQQATETVKTTFRQTPAAVGRDVARQGQQITETVRTPLQQTPGVVSGDVARQGRQATETVRAPFRQTPAVSGREVARQGQRTTETVRTPLQQTSGFRQGNQVQTERQAVPSTERQAAVRQEVRMAPPGRRPGTSTQPQHRGNIQVLEIEELYRNLPCKRPL